MPIQDINYACFNSNIRGKTKEIKALFNDYTEVIIDLFEFSPPTSVAKIRNPDSILISPLQE